MDSQNSKVAVITGAAGGLGKALAIELFRQSFNLALLDIDLPALEKLKDELGASTIRVSIHCVDVSNEKEIIAARTEILALHGQINILINNAAISVSRPFMQLTLADYKKVFDTNFWGTVYCTKHFLPDLEKQRRCHLVNIISAFAYMGFPGKTAYASSKSAIMGFTNSLRIELWGTSIKISLVIPPPMDTGLVMNNPHINEEKKNLEIYFLKKNGMPLHEVAIKILSNVWRGKYRIVVGTRMFWLDFVSRLFPSLLNKLTGKHKKRIKFV